jgi:hypothetical protein
MRRVAYLHNSENGEGHTALKETAAGLRDRFGREDLFIIF